MKAKISHGRGFRGILDYLYGAREDNHPNRAIPVVGAGNVLGPPDIKKPVWHCSLSLPRGERHSDEKWAEIARDFLIRIGIDPNVRQWHCARHVDTDHDHIHLVVHSAEKKEEHHGNVQKI